MTPMSAGVDAATALAEVHAEAFDDPWPAADIATLLESPGVFALQVRDDGPVTGFILCRVALDEAEVLTLATRPAHRRRGIGAALLGEALAVALAAGASTLFLEVAEDNAAALALYGALGFNPVGRRPGYYARHAGPAVAARVMRRDLNR